MQSLLIVDDQSAVRTLVARLAKAAGYAVREAGCAGEALDRMAASPSTVVLCDINMPDRSGLWLATQLRQQFPDTAMVMMSGFDQKELEAGLEKGAMACLSKPFTREQLMCTLERAQEWHLEQKVAAAWRTAKPSPRSG